VPSNEFTFISTISAVTAAGYSEINYWLLVVNWNV
jgi:hypothetical protein